MKRLSTLGFSFATLPVTSSPALESPGRYAEALRAYEQVLALPGDRVAQDRRDAVERLV